MNKTNLLKAVHRSLLSVFSSLTMVMSMTALSFADTSTFFTKQDPNTGFQKITGHVPLEVKNGTATFLSHPNLNINAQIIMRLQNQDQLNTVLQGLYDPKSPSYHHWYSPAEFNAQFAPSAMDITFITEYLSKYGITVPAQSVIGGVLNVTGPSSAFEKAFGGLHINNYQTRGGVQFYAPDADPVIPGNLNILAVGGLDNLPKYFAHRHQVVNALPKTVGSGPLGYLAPSDVKTAYNLNNVTATGSGQSVALFELDGYSSKDITAYESKFGLPNVPLQNILVGGSNGVPNYNAGADEVTLDIELVTAFAPGSSSILVYEAPNTNSAWIAQWNKIAADNKAKVISCSWGMVEQDSATLSFDDTIFSQMAAQGQAVFVAAGDDGAYSIIENYTINGQPISYPPPSGYTFNPPLVLSVEEPASQPYATAVGISKLTTSSGSYSSETASIYGGGGVSAYWSIPSYQASLAKTAKVSTTMRNLPDVVLTADLATPYAFYINGSWAGFYGSSIAAPVWASFISLVNQGLGLKGPIGFVNSALYQLAQSSSYSSDFHDISTGNNGIPNYSQYPGYSAQPGFDDATGLGSFNGFNLYNDLVKNSVAVSAPSMPTGLNATAGVSQVSLSWNASSGAISYDIYRSIISGASYSILASNVLNTTYTDSSVTNGITYDYEVSAVNSAGQSPKSSQVSVTPLAPSVPTAPTSLIGSAATYAGKPAVLLKWNQSNSSNIKSNNIYYSTGSSSSYMKLGNISATTSVTVTGVNNSVTYNFYVTAVNSSSLESLPSNKTSVLG